MVISSNRLKEKNKNSILNNIYLFKENKKIKKLNKK